MVEEAVAGAKLIGGLLLLGLAVLVLWKGIAMWATTHGVLAAIAQAIISILLLLVVIPLLIDSGSGLVIQATEDESPTVVKLDRQPGTPNDLILVFHGYNGYGSKLAEVLRPLTAQGTVVGFEPSENGYNSSKVTAAALDVIDELGPDRIFAEGESLGGMAIMDLLRADSSLNLDGVVFDAVPGRAAHMEPGGDKLKYAGLYPGGIVSTAALRLVQHQALKNLPAPEPHVNLEAMEEADQASLRISGPTTFGQLGYMGNFTPAAPGEFEGRVKAVKYLHAPGTSDDLVKVGQASAELQQAFGDAFEDVPVEAWMENDKPLHTPTPRRPSPVINAMRELMAA